jgi:ppGpp synthetase/RelA/SpoT-type nucleotidyltranferase
MPENLQAAAMGAYIRAMSLPDKIRPRLNESPIRANTYTINHRVKTTGKILEKVKRKRDEGRSEYGVNRVSDIVGFRLVTLFSSEVIGVVAQLLDLIMHRPELGVSPFVKGKVMEILIFDNRPKEDPLSIVAAVRSAAIERGYKEDLKNQWEERILQVKTNKTGYSSVHVVCYCETPALDGVVGSAGEMPVEIQVRTIFEDAWGEIDHKLKYKPTDGKGKSIDAEGWRTHLIALKTISDGCVQYSEIIRRQSLASRRAGEMIDTSYASIDTPVESLKRFSSYPEPVRAALKQAFELRDQAMGALLDAEQQRLLGEAIDAFDAALKILELLPSTTSAELAVATITVNVEKALCMLSTNDPTLLRDAITIYEGFSQSSEIGLRGVALYRKGQALIELRDHHGAIGTLIAAESLIVSLGEFSKHWLRSDVPRNLGFAYWQHSREMDDEERSRALLEARVCTLRALSLADEIQDAEAQLSSLNNLVWYEREIYDTHSGDDTALVAALNGHIDRLKEVFAGAAPPKRHVLTRIHSLACACKSLGRKTDAKMFAEKFLELRGANMAALDAAEEARIREDLSDGEREHLGDIMRIYRDDN